MAKQNQKGTPAPGGKSGQPKRRAVVLTSSIAGAVIVVVAVVVILIARSAASDSSAFDYAKLPRLGNVHAPVKIVEFGDFKCPACKLFHDRVFPLLMNTYIDPGVVQFYFMNYPFIGPDSTTAAIAGMAIFHQKPNAFWDYYNAMYDNQGDERVQWATPQFILKLAHRSVPGINYSLLAQEINNDTYRKQVENQYATGERLGVNSTPTLFVNGHEFLDFSNWPALQAMVEKYK